MYDPGKIGEKLVEDLEHKKVFDAQYKGYCVFGCEIFSGDQFVFIGDKGKLCDSCRYQMIDQLKGL